MKHNVISKVTYAFIVFSDTYTNLVKYQQRVPLDESINWCYLHQDAGKTYQISSMISYWKYSKAIVCRNMKKNIGDLAVTKELSWKTAKTVCSTKEKYPTTNQALGRRNGKHFCKRE